MSTESLGTARLDVAVDLTRMYAAIEQAKSLTTSLSKESQTAFGQSNEGAKSATLTLLRYKDTVGKTSDEVKLMRGVWRGVNTDVVKEIGGMIAAQRQLAEFDLAGKKAAENDRLREQERVVAALTAQFHQLEAAEQQLADFALAARKADENNFLNEQKRVVAALTAQFHQLEAAEAEAARGTAFVNQLKSQAAAIGKTNSQLLEMKANELGVAQAAAPFIAQLRAQEQQLKNTSIQFNEYGRSAKQVDAALRQVPAQITDIFVSLQGGQNPLTVLLQQGGQLRDVFGGIRPAITALGGALRSLINPWTLLAAAIAGVVTLQVAAENRSNALSAALILTGRSAVTTGDQLRDMVNVLDNTTNATAGQANEAIAAVVRTGQFAAEQYLLVADAAAAMERATGKAMDETIASFVDLQKDPVNASLRLNEQVNFLTAALYDQILAMQESGDVAGAAALATEAAAEAHKTAEAEIRENMGLVTGMWHDLKRAIAETGDGAVSFFSDLDKQASEAIGTLGRLIEAAKGAGSPGFGFALKNAFNPPANVDAPAPETAKITPEQARAMQQFHALEQSNLSKEARQLQEINKIKAIGLAAGHDQLRIQKAISESEARYAESLKKPKSARSLDNASMRNALQDFKDILAQEQAAIANSRAVLQAEYSAKLVPVEEYYAKTRQLTQSDMEAQEKALIGQIGVLRGRNAVGKDAIDIQRQLGQLESELANVRARGATELKVLGIQETAVLNSRRWAVEDYRRSQDLATLAVEEQWAAVVARISLGDQEAQQMERIASLTRKYAEEIAKLEIEKARDPANSQNWQNQIDAAKTAMDAQVEIVRRGYEQMKEAQADWQNGVTKGWADWAAQASDVAGQIARITESSLDRMTDAISEFVLTGKFNFKALLADILKEIAKFLVKQAVLSFIKILAGAMGGGAGGGGGAGDTTGGGGGAFFAKGAAFQDNKSLSQYSNGVYNTPQPFMFAKGAGIFGEAGWEAIMPLIKGPDGNLGVRANMMAGGGTTVQVNISLTINNDGTTSSRREETDGDNAAMYERFGRHMEMVAQNEIQKAMLPGGMLWKNGQGMKV